MNQIERALRGICRNWKRYTIITMVTIVIATSITVAAMVRATAGKMTKDYANYIGVSVSFTPDLRKAYALGVDENGYLQIPEITPEKLEEFSESEYLKDTLFTISVQAYGEEIQAVGQETQNNDSYGLSFVPNNGEVVDSTIMINCVLVAYSDLSLAEEFAIGLREVVQGDFIEDDNTCIVSEEFAENNGLQIGDSLQVYNAYEEAEKITLLVTGIYLDGTVLQPGGNVAAVNNRKNEILISYDTLKAQKITATNVEAIYYLKSPEDADVFEREVRGKGLPDIYNVNVDADNYYMVMEPVMGLQKVMGIMFFVVVVGGMAVLALLSILQLYDRKYELGILRAMGMRKSSVIAIMLTESFLVCVLGLVLGLGLGSRIAQSVFDMTLGQQIQAAEESKPDFSPNYGDGVFAIGNESEDSIPIEMYEVRVQLTVRTLEEIIIGVLSIGVLVNGVCLCILMQREPMKLLIER